MTNVYSKLALTTVLGLIMGLALTSVRADVKIQSLTHFGGIVGMGANNITNTSYLQGHKKRSESNTQFTRALLGTLQKWKHGDKGSNEVTIYRADENRKFILDSNNGTYRHVLVYIPPQPSHEGGSYASANNSGEQKKTIGAR